MDDRDAGRLVELGLTGYEATAYLALIRRGQSAGAEVARMAGLPRQRIYDVLDALVGRGLATVIPGRPALYVATPPDDALNQLLELRRAQLERLGRDIEETVGRLTPTYRAGRAADDPLRFVEVLREPAVIAKRFVELESAAEREILVFTKAPYVVEPADNLEGLSLLERRIEARSVYEQSIYDNPAHAAALRTFIAAGERARVVEELPIKLVLIDERVAMFTMEDPAAGDAPLTFMIVEHAALARVLKLAFESVWATGSEFV